MEIGKQPVGRIDHDEAERLLAAGESVRSLAARYGVTTQAVYLAIKTGRIQRPEAA
jgi:Mor family transcriptional regulator